MEAKRSAVARPIIPSTTALDIVGGSGVPGAVASSVPRLLWSTTCPALPLHWALHWALGGECTPPALHPSPASMVRQLGCRRSGLGCRPSRLLGTRLRGQPWLVSVLVSHCVRKHTRTSATQTSLRHPPSAPILSGLYVYNGRSDESGGYGTIPNAPSHFGGGVSKRKPTVKFAPTPMSAITSYLITMRSCRGNFLHFCEGEAVRRE